MYELDLRFYLLCASIDYVIPSLDLSSLNRPYHPSGLVVDCEKYDEVYDFSYAGEN
jgi:hypothetical protein